MNIDNTEIPWSFWGYVKKLCAGDELRTIDAFWKAHKAECKTDREIIRYVKKGLLPDLQGNRYSLQPSIEMETPAGKQKIAAWWESNQQHITHSAPKQSKELLRTLLMDIARGMKWNRSVQLA